MFYSLIHLKRGERFLGRKNSYSSCLIFILKVILLIVIHLIVINLIFTYRNSSLGNNAAFQNFSTIFLSIILEALPFIMLGAIISSLIQVFISEQTIAKIIPKNKLLGLFIASIMGMIFPVCECAIIPIVRRLIKKGVPLNIAITFMLAVPIVNPIVLASTYYAFNSMPMMVILRGVLGLVGALIIGYLIGWLEEGRNPMKKDTVGVNLNTGCSCGHDHSGHHHHHNHAHKSKVREIIGHTSSELYDIGKFLILGAFISSLFQVFVSRSYILSIGENRIYSVLAMMIFAYVISLCSEADAFIARTFLNQFTTGSITAFLILGPMIDIKNTLMLAAGFKKRFILQLTLLIFAVCFLLGEFVNIIGL